MAAIHLIPWTRMPTSQSCTWLLEYRTQFAIARRFAKKIGGEIGRFRFWFYFCMENLRNLHQKYSREKNTEKILKNSENTKKTIETHIIIRQWANDKRWNITADRWKCVCQSENGAAKVWCNIQAIAQIASRYSSIQKQLRCENHHRPCPIVAHENLGNHQ